ncbi:MAG: amidase, partial [Gemmatimonadota bacterium]
MSPSTFAEAEKLVQVQMTDAQRAMAAESWRRSMASYLERRVGPRKVTLEPEVAPATRWLPTAPPLPDRDRFVRSTTDPGPVPTGDAEIAFSPVTRLAQWIEQRKLTSER